MHKKVSRCRRCTLSISYTNVAFDILPIILTGRSYNADGKGRNYGRKARPRQQYTCWKFKQRHTIGKNKIVTAVPSEA